MGEAGLAVPIKVADHNEIQAYLREKPVNDSLDRFRHQTPTPIILGQYMWGMETKQGTVLYYCLEDTLKRIQQRLYCITENGPDNLLFETATGTLATNLEEELLRYISK